MNRQIGMTQDEKRAALAYARELLVTADQLLRIPATGEEIDKTVDQYSKVLIEMAVWEVGSVVEVADAEFHPGWGKDPRNPSGDPNRPTGFVPDADAD